MIVTFTFEICDYKHVSKWHNISMIGNVAASIESTSYLDLSALATVLDKVGETVQILALST